ncbi:MAG: hypothetical protein R2730_12415 [Chitinophagales bacterium]
MNEKFEELKRILAEVEEDVQKFNSKNNKSAGLRVRKSMQEVKNIAQDIRKFILDKKNGNIH